MNTLIIDKLEFKRIILNITCRFTAPVNDKEPVFSLFDKAADKKLLVEEIKKTEDGYHLRINTMELENEYPITNGRYKLAAESDGELCFATVSDDVADLIDKESPAPYTIDWVVKKSTEETVERTIYPTKECDLRVDRMSGNHWHGFSEYDKETKEYCLDVDFLLGQKVKAKKPFYKKLKPKRLKKKFMKWAYKTYFNYYNKKPKTGNKILFTSDRSNELADNEKWIYERMIERGFDKKYEFHFEFKDGIKARRSFRDKLSFAKNFATADYIFVDDYQPELYKIQFSPEVKIIQLWHACGAFKTIGFERLDSRGAPAFMTKVHKCYTHVTVSSDHSGDHNAEAFAIKRSKFYPVGIARTDMFFDDNAIKAAKERVLEAYPFLATRTGKAIMYAPTFRGKNAKDASFPFELLDLERLGKYCLETGSVLLIKMHPFVRTPIEIPEKYKDVIFDATSYPDINEMLMTVDLVITDYSSLIYEAGLLHLPMLFYAFDLDEYDTDRGFYEPFEETVPGKIVMDMDELMDAIRNEDYQKEKLEGFLKKNFKYLDGKSTDRTIDLIFPRS